jgi:hypothetical protein
VRPATDTRGADIEIEKVYRRGGTTTSDRNRWNSEIWKCGNLEIWRCGDVEM